MCSFLSHHYSEFNISKCIQNSNNLKQPQKIYIETGPVGTNSITTPQNQIILKEGTEGKNVTTTCIMKAQLTIQMLRFGSHCT